MAEEIKEFNLMTPYGDEVMTVKGTDTEIKKALTVLGEFFLTNENLTSENICALVGIGEYLWNQGKASPEELAAAKKFFEAAEKYADPQGTDYLSCMQENPLISEAMWLRAAERNAPCPIDSLQEEYGQQAIYWRKKIAEVEGKPFEGDAPTDEEILQSQRLNFFNVYKRAFDGDLDAMKTCAEFCEEEENYWRKRA